MLRVVAIHPEGAWASPAADRVVLSYDARSRRRRALTSEGGLAFLLDRGEATPLRAGDGLELGDGRIVAVGAADEPLLELTAADPRRLVRIAWHLGNRHLPTEIHDRRLVIRADRVIAAMVESLGGAARPFAGPFNPEGGAYAHGH
jgi:urease accessory protein